MSEKKYDKDNVFAKIIRGEIPSSIVYEDEDVLCFNDIHPVAKVHVLIIPKGEYVDIDDFIRKAGKDKVADFFSKIPIIAEKLGVKEYRIVSNCGKSAGQIIFHFHIHLISGKEN